MKTFIFRYNRGGRAIYAVMADSLEEAAALCGLLPVEKCYPIERVQVEADWWDCHYTYEVLEPRKPVDISED